MPQATSITLAQLQALQGLAGESEFRVTELRKQVIALAAALETMLSDGRHSADFRVINVGDRRAGLTSLREFTEHATRITIVDPYIYSGKRQDAQRHAEEFVEVCRIQKKDGPQSIRIVHDPDNTTKAIRSHIRKACSHYGVKLTDAETREIHDRVWIKDDRIAIVAGTSLNGLGNKVCFLLELPEEDLRAFKRILADRSLLPGT